VVAGVASFAEVVAARRSAIGFQAAYGEAFLLATAAVALAGLGALAGGRGGR